LIFNLPLTLISLSPQMQSLEEQKPSLTAWFWILLLIGISSWGQVALLLGAQKAVGGQHYTIGQSINRAQRFLIKYLTLLASVTLFIFGLIIAAGISMALVLVFLPQVNKILAVLVCCLIIVALITALVFFLLRWSLASAVCVFENTWPKAALRGSFALVKDQINPLTGVYGLMILVYAAGLAPMILTQVLTGVSQDPGSAQTGMTSYMFMINLVLAPLWNTLTVVLYNKLKEVLETHVHA